MFGLFHRFSVSQTQIFVLQRQQAAVLENWVLWISPPSPCFMAETPSTKRPCLSSPPPSHSVFTSSSTAWTTHSLISGTAKPPSKVWLEERVVCIDVWLCVLLLSASIEVRKAAAQCAKNILATQSGVDFWEQHKDNRDPMLAYLNPFRKAKKKVGEGCFHVYSMYIRVALHSQTCVI